jgi:hypothetical protein
MEQSSLIIILLLIIAVPLLVLLRTRYFKNLADLHTETPNQAKKRIIGYQKNYVPHILLGFISLLAVFTGIWDSSYRHSKWYLCGGVVLFLIVIYGLTTRKRIIAEARAGKYTDKNFERNKQIALIFGILLLIGGIFFNLKSNNQSNSLDRSDFTACQTLQKDQQWLCLMDIIEKTGDANYCSQYFSNDVRKRDICISRSANEKHFCDLIQNKKPYYFDDCLSHVYITHADSEGCATFEGKNLRRNCYIGIAHKTNDVNLCNKEPISKGEDFIEIDPISLCYWDIAKNTQNPSLCDKMVAYESFIKGCKIEASEPLNTYGDQTLGIQFQYPKVWKLNACENGSSSSNCIIIFDAGKSYSYSSVSNTVEVEAGTTTNTHNAKELIHDVQKIIDSNYSTPPDTFGVNTNYHAESWRYKISNFTNKSGLKIYHYNYVGKYSIIENHYCVDTKKNMTACIMSSSDDFDREAESSFTGSTGFRNFLDSIKLL